MVAWHHRLDGYESEQALGIGIGEGSGDIQIAECDIRRQLVVDDGSGESDHIGYAQLFCLFHTLSPFRLP